MQCTAIQETFREVKLAFRQYKLRVRKALLPHQSIDESLEEAVTNYIDRHGEFHEVFGLKYHEVEEVVNVRLPSQSLSEKCYNQPSKKTFPINPVKMFRSTL